MSAMRKIRVARAGFDPSAEEVDDAFELLNSMIRSWSLENLVIPSRVQEDVPILSGVNPQTIGTGGQVNTAQPMNIEAATLRNSDGDHPLDILFTAQQYQRIRIKTLQGRPDRLWFERAQTLGKLYFDYVPDQAYTLSMVSLKPLTAFATQNTDLTVPEEYELAITHNLAVLLAPEYGKEASPTIQGVADSSLRSIRAKNLASRVPIIVPDAALLRSRPFNIDVIE